MINNVLNEMKNSAVSRALTKICLYVAFVIIMVLNCSTGERKGNVVALFGQKCFEVVKAKAIEKQ